MGQYSNSGILFLFLQTKKGHKRPSVLCDLFVFDHFIYSKITIFFVAVKSLVSKV